MAHGLPYSMSRRPQARKPVHRVSIHKQVTVNVDGATGVGWGTAILEGLPEGNIAVETTECYITVDDQAHANIVDTFEGDFGIGTTPASDATISGADVDIIASTAIAAATAGVSPRTKGQLLTDHVIDNTAADKEINFSLLIDDVDIDADDIDMLVTVEFEMIYSLMLDD